MVGFDIDAGYMLNYMLDYMLAAYHSLYSLYMWRHMHMSQSENKP